MTDSKGLSHAGQDRLAEVVGANTGPDRIPGMVVLVAVGEEIHVELSGHLAVAGEPVQRDSLFRLSSTTKPMTGAVTLVLAEEGRFGLDDPVDSLLPELADRRVLRQPGGALDDTVAAHRPVTVRDLLTFTNGFGMCVEMFMAAEPWPVVVEAEQVLSLRTLGPPQPAEQPDPDTWIKRLGSLPLMAQPGERWLYNTGASILSVLVSRAAGAPIEEVYRSRLFEPLGMTDTAFFTTETDRLATAYAASPEGLVVWDPPDGTWSRPPAFADGSAGLVSTADDLLAFSRLLLGGGNGIVSADAVRAMTTDQLTPAQRARGGFGPFDTRSWGYCVSVLDSGAFGWDGGLGTSWLVDPALDLTVMVLSQRMFETSEPPAAHRQIQDVVFADLGRESS